MKVGHVTCYCWIMVERSSSSGRLRNIINQQRNELPTPPPPAPAGTTLREWFAGLALGNVELMRGVASEQRASVALRIADELISALTAPRRLSPTSLLSPSEDDMKRWDASLAEIRNAQARQARDTLPDVKRDIRAHSQTKKTIIGVAIPPNPPEGYVPSPASQPAPTPGVSTSSGVDSCRYSIMSPPDGILTPLPSRRKV